MSPGGNGNQANSSGLTNKGSPKQAEESSSNSAGKNHKVEGKNKKSLHHKQQQQGSVEKQQKLAPASQATQVSPSNRKNQPKVSNTTPVTASKAPNRPSEGTGGANDNVCSTLDDFSKRAQELKADITGALEKQARHQNTDQPIEVMKLKDDILKLSGLEIEKKDEEEEEAVKQTEVVEEGKANESIERKGLINSIENVELSSQKSDNSTGNHLATNDMVDSSGSTIKSTEKANVKVGYKSDNVLNEALDKLTVKDDTIDGTENKIAPANKSKSSTKMRNLPNEQQKSVAGHAVSGDDFELLEAKLDAESKFVALMSSLQKRFQGLPSELLTPLCRKLVTMSEQNGQVAMDCEKYRTENQQLNKVKQKLENICRELQKSNNAIRIESLDLIKAEQGKAKDQTTKIQSTLSGVIKLFDENQQRNMSLRQENQELQTKLKSLLEHCDSWEKSVEAALRQRDIEIRLVKTELAKANLLKNEEKEKFLGEKQELLQILSMMQEQQHRIEGQEAKLRSDLSSYASKYDECQAVISKGMNRFQTESKRMLKQIEKSREDYKCLLAKYESTNRRLAQLLEEKQCWDKTLVLANKKIQTLEKLCRALSERKSDQNNTATAIENNPPKQKSQVSLGNTNKATKTNSSTKESVENSLAKDLAPTNNDEKNLETNPAREQLNQEFAAVNNKTDEITRVTGKKQVLNVNNSVKIQQDLLAPQATTIQGEEAQQSDFEGVIVDATCRSNENEPTSATNKLAPDDTTTADLINDGSSSAKQEAS